MHKKILFGYFSSNKLNLNALHLASALTYHCISTRSWPWLADGVHFMNWQGFSHCRSACAMVIRLLDARIQCSNSLCRGILAWTENPRFRLLLVVQYWLQNIDTDASRSAIYQSQCFCVRPKCVYWLQSRSTRSMSTTETVQACYFGVGTLAVVEDFWALCLGPIPMQVNTSIC